jgi:hypothetical protein
MRRRLRDGVDSDIIEKHSSQPEAGFVASGSERTPKSSDRMTGTAALRPASAGVDFAISDNDAAAINRFSGAARIFRRTGCRRSREGPALRASSMSAASDQPLDRKGARGARCSM